MKLFESRIPETESVSCVIAVMSDSDSCVLDAMRARTWPTRRCAMTSTGISTTATRVSCQLSTIIATSAAMTVTVLPSTLETVLVRNAATPPTSFCSLDWITPVFVRVKKPSSMLCRWRNRSTRMDPMTRLPTVAVRYVCQTPRPAPATQIAIMMATSSTSTGMSGPPVGGKSPRSKACCVSSGGTTVRPAPTSTSAIVRTSARRCGRNSSAIRPSRFSTRGASAFALRCASASAALTRPRRPPPPRIPPPAAMSPILVIPAILRPWGISPDHACARHDDGPAARASGRPGRV